MNEKDVKNILLELKKRRINAENKIIDRISDAELKHSYNGKWYVMIIIKSQNTGYSRDRYDSKEKAMMDIEKIWQGEDWIVLRNGDTLPIDQIVLIMPMPVKG